MSRTQTAFQRACLAIADDAILRDAVLDVQLDEDTLVVLVDASVPRSFMRNTIARYWPGPLEVFCASGLMVGACEDV